MKNDLESRDSSLDLVRICAVLGVIAVHFFGRSGFYQSVIEGTSMYFMITGRNLFMYCVPLFLILSGYLMNRKTLSRHYYQGLLKTLRIYILASIANTIGYSLQGYHTTPKSFFFSLLDFSACPYGWYIEMYIGLFLLIPFLNQLYHLLAPKQKVVLILTMLLLTALPPTLNNTQKMMPAWWEAFYPITYYFIGCFIYEYKPHIKKRILGAFLFVHVVIGGYVAYRLSYQRSFSGTWQDHGALFTLINTVCIFLLITEIDTSNWRVSIKHALQYISGLTLGTYLVSSSVDNALYAELINKVPVVADRMRYFLPMVLSVFFCALLISVILDGINRIILAGKACLQKKIRKCNTH